MTYHERTHMAISSLQLTEKPHYSHTPYFLTSLFTEREAIKPAHKRQLQRFPELA